MPVTISMENTGLYRIAGLTIRMQCFGEIIQKQGRPYHVGTADEPDFEIIMEEENIKRFMKENPHLKNTEAEYMLSGFYFARNLLDYNGFCLHSSAISIENKAILFSAPCGTGKSTHTRLWQEYFGTEKVIVINDDKPALRYIDGEFLVYGTPWSGKSDLNKNIKVPLKAVVFMERSEKNYIRRLSNREAAVMLIYQSILTKSRTEEMDKLFAVLGPLIQKTAIFKMGCTISTEAVGMVYRTVVNAG